MIGHLADVCPYLQTIGHLAGVSRYLQITGDLADVSPSSVGYLSDIFEVRVGKKSIRTARWISRTYLQKLLSVPALL